MSSFFRPWEKNDEKTISTKKDTPIIVKNLPPFYIVKRIVIPEQSQLQTPPLVRAVGNASIDLNIGKCYIHSINFYYSTYDTQDPNLLSSIISIQASVYPDIERTFAPGSYYSGVYRAWVFPASGLWEFDAGHNQKSIILGGVFSGNEILASVWKVSSSGLYDLPRIEITFEGYNADHTVLAGLS